MNQLKIKSTEIQKRRGTKDYATRQSEIEDKSEQNQSTKKGFFVCGWGLGHREALVKLGGIDEGHAGATCITSKGLKRIY